MSGDRAEPPGAGERGARAASPRGRHFGERVPGPAMHSRILRSARNSLSRTERQTHEPWGHCLRLSRGGLILTVVVTVQFSVERAKRPHRIRRLR